MIEEKNAKEEMIEIMEKCMKCGLCKELCPVFRVIREEAVSPRGKINLLRKEIYDKLIFECALCKACEIRCPLNLKLCDAFKKARFVLAESGKSTAENEEMIKNIRKFGNPFGEANGEKKKFYCC